MFSQILSTLEVFHLETGEREIIYNDTTHFEAPNWSPDGSFLIFNSEGRLYRFDLETKTKDLIDTGHLNTLNNDHGFSPDGSEIVISAYNPPEDAEIPEQNWLTSKIYTLPVTGGLPKLITKNYPSFWHGWSPDGKTLAFTGRRQGDFNIYTIDINSKEEIQLTSAPGLDDGPEYSPNGKYIYYNSMQSGKMELWRMNSDGDNKLQLTNDSFSNWFPHPSPEGNSLVYIAYLEDQGADHPPMKNVALRLFNLKDKSIKTLCEFIGGQGSINVPSWSPDGKKFAFVSYKFME
ncbi:TolB family protein [Gaetbulibacter aestuarii]|uniref:Transporter n=1 Tax=Gaetbulibacter aestuarii TaxID=1502358 RepID=A0ABW7MYU9_9FLAO